MKNTLTSIGWLLVGLLVIAAIVLSAGSSDFNGKPEADSYKPYGMAALFSLLQKKGYQVDIDRSLHPKPKAGEVAIAFYDDTSETVESPYSQGGEDQQPKSSGGDDVEQAKTDLNAAANQGAIVIQLPYSPDFGSESNYAGEPRAYRRGDRQVRLLTSFRQAGQAKADVFPFLGSPQTCFIGVNKTGKGYAISYLDSLGLTNRYIDKGQNAEAFLETLEAFAPPHTRVLFTEATIGEGRDKGLLATIGMWAPGSWYQLLFLFVVIIYSLNRRFGLPEQYRPAQKGSRELLDAITDIYTRARASGAALEAAAARTESQLRSVLKVPMDAGPGELNRLLPESLVMALSNVKAASEIKKTSPANALALIQKLELETSNFLAEHRIPVRRRKRAA